MTSSDQEAAAKRALLAAERAELAGARVGELHDRAEELAAWKNPPLRAQVARAALADAAERAAQAEQYAWVAYLRAAQAHRNAAVAAESRGDSTRAHEQRELAAADDARAAALG
jgi:hypothetical protein